MRTSAAREHRLDRLVRWLLCTIIGHKYRVVRRLNDHARKISCLCCEKAWAMHDPTRSFVPWDEDFERIYAPGGPLNPLPPNTEVSGARREEN